MNIKNRTIFTRDCLEVMRGMQDRCIDLIYLDPPFKSDANYAAPVGSEAAGAEFKDTWGLSDIDVAWYGEIAEKQPGLYELLSATRMVNGDSMMSYLIYMAIRMIEMKRILKDTGSIYLHCDHHAIHYLKLMMDAIFAKNNFRNEIIWRRDVAGKGAKKKSNQLPRNHDTILFYTKSGEWLYEQPYTELNDKQKKSYRYVEEGTGRKYKAVQLGDYSDKSIKRMESENLIYVSSKGKKYKKYYLDKAKATIDDIWTDILGFGTRTASKERTGYKTQKPLQLLQRIISISSNPGDMVLDPFCGCATACVAAEIEGREWIGIDVGPKAYDLVKSRLAREVQVGDGKMFGNVIHREDIPGDRKGKKSKNIRHIRYGEQEGKCNGCLEQFPFKNMTEDHIVPQCKGGSDTDDNIQLLCAWCNSKKGGTRTHDELVSILIQEGVRK